jgi:hypothetical protein
MQDASRAIEDLIAEHMPVSHAAFEAAARGLFLVVRRSDPSNYCPTRRRRPDRRAP